MSKLVLIDGNAIMHRAYHALPPLTSSSGEPINAVYGFVSMLLKIITDLKPTYIATAFDRKEPTFRHKEFKAYQAQRPEMEEDLSSQFEKAREVLDAVGIPVYSKAGYEADDIIGTIAKKGSKLKTLKQVVIVTGDKDILQLVKGKVKVYLPVRGLSEAKLMGESEVKEKIGVVPMLIPDYKALVGDPSDNYPGVFGIGPKMAVNLLTKYKSVGNVYRNLKKIPPRTREKLEKGKDLAYISHRLATIVTDVDFDFDVKKMDDWQLDSKKVIDLFEKFGFKTLTKRIKESGKRISEERQMKLI